MSKTFWFGFAVFAFTMICLAIALPYDYGIAGFIAPVLLCCVAFGIAAINERRKGFAN